MDRRGCASAVVYPSRPGHPGAYVQMMRDDPLITSRPRCMDGHVQVMRSMQTNRQTNRQTCKRHVRTHLRLPVPTGHARRRHLFTFRRRHAALRVRRRCRCRRRCGCGCGCEEGSRSAHHFSHTVSLSLGFVIDRCGERCSGRGRVVGRELRRSGQVRSRIPVSVFSFLSFLSCRLRSIISFASTTALSN